MLKSLKSRFRGVKVQKLHAVLMVLGCLLTLLLFVSSITIQSKYRKIEYSMNDYTECNKAIYELRDACDFLTNQVWLYTVNLEPEFMANYFREYNDLRRRQNALEILEMTHKGDVPDINLQLAMTESEFLAKRECYTMKLISVAIGFPEAYMPEPVRNYQLSEEDMNLSDEDKIVYARSVIFDSAYLASKDRILSYANNALSSLINSYIIEKNTNDASIRTAFFRQVVYISLLFLFCVILYILLVVLVLVPLNKNLMAIQKGTKMQLNGAFEVQYIASAYNALCDKNAVTASVLKHKAEHDPLTGLINRNAFDQIKTALMGEQEPISYLIIDIDLFKKINDNYGHPIGDEVLKKVSRLLSEQFRQTDYVARIGGDEFAVIMTKFGDNADEIIKRKIGNLNLALQAKDENLPPVTLSVGVSYSEKGYIPVLVEKADRALYSVKRNGRCNCAFYEEIKK